MMAVGSITGANNSAQAACSGMDMQTDSVSKNIQNQIANAQKRLQELSSNDEITLEEKMKKRQEIQQEITNLNQQLRQRRIEQRKEQQSKAASMDDMLGKNKSTGAAKPGSKGSGMSQSSMQAMISADASMKQAQVQGSVASSMEGRAGVLEAEIKTDQGRGTDTEKKEAELAQVKQKAVNAAAAQINTLASVNETMEEAAKANRDGRTDEEDTKNGRTDEKETKGSRTGEAETKSSTTDKADKNEQETDTVSEGTIGAEAAQANAHTHVDVCL